MSEPIEVLITLPISEGLQARLSNVSPRLHINLFQAHKVEDIPDELWGKAEVLYTNRLLPAPEKAPNLRWIQMHWAGVDHIRQAPILKKPSLVITTLSGASASQVAEFVVTMVLALGHCLTEILASQRRVEWPRDRWERFSPQELRNSTVGIVGYGSIGRQVARLLYPFGVQVLASKRNAMHPEDSGYIPEGLGDPEGNLVYRLYPPEALRSMIKLSDFVVVSLPLTDSTRNMIGAQELAAMKPSAYLVDVSRGGIVDHNALTAALRDRRIAGATLDVFPEEPLPAESPLWKMPNVILTPHIAGNTPLYDERAVDLFSENLRRYIAGLPLYNRFDVQVGY